jgi:hypothetical protein
MRKVCEVSKPERALSSVGRASRLHRRTGDEITTTRSTRGRTERDSMANKAQSADHSRTIPQPALSDLARAKAAFQLRTIALVLGVRT